MLGLWALAFAAAVGAFFQLTDSSANSSAATSILLSAAGLFFIGLLLFPSAFYAFQHISGRTVRQTKLPGSSFALIIFLLPLALGLGQLISNQNFAWLALPPLHLVATALAVAWLLWLALRGLQPGSAQRAWGAFGSGLTLTPFFAFAIEITGIVILLVFGIIYIGLNPELARAFESASRLAERLGPDSRQMLVALQPVFSDPFLIILFLGSLSLIVPLIEELLKPIGVYLLLGRRLNPSQGFALGAICGAGYALVESLMTSAGPEAWASTSAARVGTSAMHIFTAALSGYALVRAKNERRYLQLAGTYLTNVALHGLWNVMAVLSTAAALGLGDQNGFVPAHLIVSSWIVLFILATGSILLLNVSNHRLRAAAVPITRKVRPTSRR